MCVYVYICVYIYLNHFAVRLKVTQHCKSTILQFFKKLILLISKTKKRNLPMFIQRVTDP